MARSKIKIAPGQVARALERECTIIDVIDLQNVLVRFHDTNRPAQVRVTEIDLAPMSPQAESRPTVGAVSLLQNKQWHQARERFEAIRSILNVPKFSRTPHLYEEAANVANRSVTTIYRWVSIYEEEGNLVNSRAMLTPFSLRNLTPPETQLSL
jgi:hypothetical protein